MIDRSIILFTGRNLMKKEERQQQLKKRMTAGGAVGVVAVALLAIILIVIGGSGKNKTVPSSAADVTAAPTEMPVERKETKNDTHYKAEGETVSAVFLGVDGYVSRPRGQVLNPSSAVFRFEIDGKEELYKIDPGNYLPEGENASMDYGNVSPAEEGAYPVQNVLEEGKTYTITVKDGTVTAVDASFAEGSLKKAVAGKRTLANFIQTALEPLGSTLYVYGGGWDYQDVGSSHLTRTTGLSPSWKEFFEANDSSYEYKNENDKEHSTYPFGAWNEYYYKGLDCSGYLGWTLYNTLYAESLAYPGFVMSSTKMAGTLAEKDLGTLVTLAGSPKENAALLRAGDICSIKGHVFICLGKCDDGSLVIAHSTVQESSSGAKGGGVTLSALNPTDKPDADCDAYKAVDSVLKEKYADWESRYPAVVKPYEEYLDFSDERTGVFRFHTDGRTLTDEEGVSGMGAREVLRLLTE